MDCIISLFFVNLYNYENNNLSFSNIVTLIIIKKNYVRYVCSCYELHYELPTPSQKRGIALCVFLIPI